MATAIADTAIALHHVLACSRVLCVSSHICLGCIGWVLLSFDGFEKLLILLCAIVGVRM